MNDTISWAWRRGAAVAFAALLLAGCSSSSDGKSATPGGSASPTPTSGPDAIRLAKAAMSTIHSYAFRLSVQQSGAHSSALTASGVVQVPDRLSGAFTVSGRTVHVLVGPKGEYVQLPGKKWQHQAETSVHPLEWNKVLAAVDDPQLSRGTGEASWRVTAHPSAALSKVLVLTATPTLDIKDVELTLDLDSHCRVIRMDAVATGTDAGAQATVHETVIASGYDSQKPVPDEPAAGAT